MVTQLSISRLNASDAVRALTFFLFVNLLIFHQLSDDQFTTHQLWHGGCNRG